jgi:hypothetical protein
MKRWHADYPRTHREWRRHYLDHVESNVYSAKVIGGDPWQVDCVCDVQKGRFRKRRAFGCNNTRCGWCHGDKYPRRTLTRQEVRAALRFREGLAEVSG